MARPGAAVSESYLDELKRYVGFGAADEEALRELAPVAAPHYRVIAEKFYDIIEDHEQARAVLSGPEQIERLKGTLVGWMDLLFRGPWDAAYFAQRARIGRVHVKINLPQRYMFTAMNVIRCELHRIAQEHHEHDAHKRMRAVLAIAKILDIELAIMLETYREAFIERVQELERRELSMLTQRLAITEARYDEIVERGPALIVTAEQDGRIVLFNGRCEALTGIDRRRAMSMTWYEIFAGGDEGEELRALAAQALAGARVAPVEAPLISPGGAEHWVRWMFTTIPGAHAPLLCAIGIETTDERVLAVRTRRAERLAALGTMAAGLAHEIRNPLNAAGLQLTVLQRRLSRVDASDPEATVTAAQLAASEIKRVGMLVDEFLQFARPHPLRPISVDLRSTCETVVELMKPAADAAATTLELLPGGPVPAYIDEERVKQVLHNVLRNAIEATGRNGQVRISVEATPNKAVLEIADDGPGFPPDAPIFEPFFTTKEGGTGLGLAIVHRIISDHGGKIDVDRRSGWTIFTIVLPAAP